MRPRHLLVAAVGLLFLTGCGPGKLNVTKDISLDDKITASAIELDAQKKPQNITVTFTSSEGDVTVLLFKADDVKGEEGLIMAPSDKALGKKSGKQDSFTAELPADTAGTVVVRGSNAKKTTVKVTVTN